MDYPSDRKSRCLYVVVAVAPKAKPLVHERDLCDFYFSAGKYMVKAFLEDARREINLAHTTGEAGATHDMGVAGEAGDCQEQEKYGRMNGTGDSEAGGLGAPLRPSGVVDVPIKLRGRRHPLLAGAAMKTCAQNVLPELMSLVAATERWARPNNQNIFCGRGVCLV